MLLASLFPFFPESFSFAGDLLGLMIALEVIRFRKFFETRVGDGDSTLMFPTVGVSAPSV